MWARLFKSRIFKEKGGHMDSVVRNSRDVEEKMWVFEREGRRKRRNERRKGSRTQQKQAN